MELQPPVAIEVDRIDIEVATACNLGCAACPRTVAVHRDGHLNAFMRPSRFRNILDGLPSARLLMFDGEGEPTLHPSFAELVDAARGSGKFAAVGVVTNGLALEPSQFESLHARGLDRIAISADSLDPELADLLRAGTDTTRLVTALRAAARFNHSSAIITVSRLNIDALADTLAAAAGTGIHRIEVHPLRPTARATTRWCLDAADRARVATIVAEVGRHHPRTTFVTAPAFTTGDRRCARPERVLAISVEGLLMPCTTMADPTLFGRIDLAAMPFEVVRRDPRFLEWHAGFAETEPSACATCGFAPHPAPKRRRRSAAAKAAAGGDERPKPRTRTAGRAGGPRGADAAVVTDAAPANDLPSRDVPDAAPSPRSIRFESSGAVMSNAPSAAAPSAAVATPAEDAAAAARVTEAAVPAPQPAAPAQPPAAAASAKPVAAEPPAASALARAIALQQQGDFDGADTLLRAVVRSGDFVEAMHRLGIGALQRGDLAEGVRLLDTARSLSDDPRIAYNAGVALGKVGRNADAIALAREWLGRFPDHVGLHQLLAAQFLAVGDVQSAADTHGRLAERALKGASAVVEQAVAAILAIGREPQNLIVLANLLRIGGRQPLALKLLDMRLAARPNDIPALLTRAMAGLAIVHASEDEIDVRRARYTEALGKVADAVASASEAELAEAAGIVGVAKPFFLAYQGYDDRALQAVYGAAIARLVEASGQNRGWTPPPAPAQGEKIRIGFATLYAYTHSVLKLFLGWLETIDRSRFEVALFQFGASRDALTERAIAAVDHYHCGQRPTAEWIGIIRDFAPHALVYLELGMDQTAIPLAATRLAPVQCMTWGHPETSGLPDMDYFLTSDLMEPIDGERHYTEALVRLPNLSIAYGALPSEGGRLTRAELGLRDDAVVYVCCQSLFKYLPRYDSVFVEIARRVPEAMFLFIGDPGSPVTVTFRTRLEAAFAAGGLEAARHVSIVRPIAFELFPSFLKCGDVYLDSIGWSGGNTTLEAVTCDLPFVTLPVGPMRGRHSFAIARMMGADGFIAESIADYVAIAVDLADPAIRDSAIDLVRENKARLYGDTEPTRALESFVRGAVAKAYREGPRGAVPENGDATGKSDAAPAQPPTVRAATEDGSGEVRSVA